jgi:pyrroline-5-carboxylate reductase
MLDGKKIGFIGGGNMAEAIIKGLIAGGVPAGAIMVAEPAPLRRDFLSSEYAAEVTDDNLDVARQADIIILAVKPQVAASVLTGLEPVISSETLIVSIMAGISTGFIEKTLTNGVRVARAMPNTPALVQAAATAICLGRKATGTDLDITRNIFSRVGSVVIVPESQMDAVTALSGSGPAYVFVMIEALSDAGVKNGLPRDVATTLAVQTVLGAARMITETGEHPALLRERVTSPGGTTIAALHALENGRFRGVIMDAIDTARHRSQELSS